MLIRVTARWEAGCVAARKVLINGAGGGVGTLRGADRQAARRGTHRRRSGQQAGQVPRARIRPRDRLLARGLHAQREDLRPHPGRQDPSIFIRLPARSEPGRPLPHLGGASFRASPRRGSWDRGSRCGPERTPRSCHRLPPMHAVRGLTPGSGMSPIRSSRPALPDLPFSQQVALS